MRNGLLIPTFLHSLLHYIHSYLNSLGRIVSLIFSYLKSIFPHIVLTPKSSTSPAFSPSLPFRSFLLFPTFYFSHFTTTNMRGVIWMSPGVRRSYYGASHIITRTYLHPQSTLQTFSSSLSYISYTCENSGVNLVFRIISLRWERIPNSNSFPFLPSTLRSTHLPTHPDL